MEFAMQAIKHNYLLHPEHGLVVGKPPHEANYIILAHMCKYLFCDSCSASAHLQSLLCYGMKLGQDSSSSLLFKWSPQCDCVTSGTDFIEVRALQKVVENTLVLARGYLEYLLLADDVLSEGVDLGRYKDDLRNMQPAFSFVQASKLKVGSFCLHQAARGNVPQSHPLLDPSSSEPVFVINGASR